MEFLIVILVIFGLIFGYFFIGITVSFIISWWLLAIGTPLLLIIATMTGWAGAIVSIAIWCLLLVANNKWHDNPTYISLINKINKMFNLSDT